jgi:hypothetical protein
VHYARAWCVFNLPPYLLLFARAEHFFRWTASGDNFQAALYILLYLYIHRQSTSFALKQTMSVDRSIWISTSNIGCQNRLSWILLFGAHRGSGTKKWLHKQFYLHFKQFSFKTNTAQNIVNKTDFLVVVSFFFVSSIYLSVVVVIVNFLLFYYALTAKSKQINYSWNKGLKYCATRLKKLKTTEWNRRFHSADQIWKANAFYKRQ